MTDRELLEAAARAAGLKPPMPMHGPGLTWGHGWWNPLVDSGEALELAVKLAIDFKIRNEATWWDHQESEGVVYWSHEPHNGDPLAATRRAIVRAAAEAGRSMT